MNEDVRWTFCAHVDLLGFANQIALSKSDVRTEMGALAVQRLKSLEDAIGILEKEKARYPQLYPTSLRYVRFNDALFFGIDVEKLPPPKARGGYTLHDLRKAYPGEGEKASSILRESSERVAKFLGLVARVHNHINKRESQESLPGCRTVVSSGLRKCFTDMKGEDDFFSANFSVSVAFKAQELGSRAGIKGNNFYVEEDVAVAGSDSGSCHAIIALAKYTRPRSLVSDPYVYIPSSVGHFETGPWQVHEPIRLEILGAEYSFRRLNPFVLTNLQLSAEYTRIAQKTEPDELALAIRHSLASMTPELDQLAGAHSRTHLFLFTYFDLDADYEHFF